MTQTDFSHNDFAHWGKNFVDTVGVKVSALPVEGLFKWNQTPVQHLRHSWSVSGGWSIPFIQINIIHWKSLKQPKQFTRLKI